jgi:hypothetical protein
VISIGINIRSLFEKVIHCCEGVENNERNTSGIEVDNVRIYEKALVSLSRSPMGADLTKFF